MDLILCADENKIVGIDLNKPNQVDRRNALPFLSSVERDGDFWTEKEGKVWRKSGKNYGIVLELKSEKHEIIL